MRTFLPLILLFSACTHALELQDLEARVQKAGIDIKKAATLGSSGSDLKAVRPSMSGASALLLVHAQADRPPLGAESRGRGGALVLGSGPRAPNAATAPEALADWLEVLVRVPFSTSPPPNDGSLLGGLSDADLLRELARR